MPKTLQIRDFVKSKKLKIFLCYKTHMIGTPLHFPVPCDIDLKSHC